MSRSTRVLRILSLLSIFLLDGVASQQCEPCFGGAEADDDDDDCTDLISASRALVAGTPECSSSQLENFQSACCDRSPRGFCSLCPDGASFDASRVVPNLNPDAGDLTCADLNGDENYLDYIFQPGMCFDTFLQRSAAWCGCPGVERKCSLCPDGSRPPDPSLVEKVYYGWSCDAFDFVSSYFNEDECITMSTEILEFDAAAFCGCPDAPQPKICDVCPDGQQIAYPNTKLGSGSFTCRDLALSTWYIPTFETCVRVLTGYRSKGYIDECCAVPIHDQSGGAAISAIPQSGLLLTMLLVGAMMVRGSD